MPLGLTCPAPSVLASALLPSATAAHVTNLSQTLRSRYTLCRRLLPETDLDTQETYSNSYKIPPGQPKAPSCTCLNQTGAGGAFVWPGCIFGAFSYMFFWFSLRFEVSEVSFDVLEVRGSSMSRCPR